MKTRIVAGVSAAAFVLLLLFGGTFPMITSVVLFLAVVAYLEYDRLFFTERNLARQLGVVVLILLTILAIRQDLQSGFFALMGSFVLISLYHVFNVRRTGDNSKTVQSVSQVYLGYIYIVSLVGFILPIVERPVWGRHYLLLLFLWVFIGDSAAYFAGKAFGKHKLASEISPGKTIEGAVGALVSSVLVSLFWTYFQSPGSFDGALALRLSIAAPLFSILAQMGDLFESMLKRSRLQKDSGAFLPGHGGLLDRIDGLGFAAPVFYFFILFFIERPM